MKVYVNAKGDTVVNMEIISEKEYNKQWDDTYEAYYTSLEVFQAFLDMRINQKEFENPEKVIELFYSYCQEKAEDEMRAKWKEMEVVVGA